MTLTPGAEPPFAPEACSVRLRVVIWAALTVCICRSGPNAAAKIATTDNIRVKPLPFNLMYEFYHERFTSVNRIRERGCGELC